MARARRDGAGGIRGLVDELSARGEAIDADLQAFYGLSLEDVFTGRLSLRRLGSLLRHLPLDGTAQWRDIRRNRPKGTGKPVPPPDDFWTPERDLLAALVDHVRVLVWQNTKDGHEGKNYPDPLPRPGFEKPEPAKPVDARVAMARLAEMAGRSGGVADDPGDEHEGEAQASEDAQA